MLMGRVTRMAMVAAHVLATLTSCMSTTNIYSAAVINGTSAGQYISSASGFDSPKVFPINRSSYDWWYFDIVSENRQYSTSLAFIAAPGTAFPTGLPETNMLLGVVFLSTPEQPLSTVYQLLATEAIVVSDSDGASGVWNGTGMQFRGSEDLRTFQLDIDMPGLGLSGNLSLTSRAPAHYPSGPAQAGLSMEVMPGVGWANAVPDGDAEVYYVVNGTEIKFSGVGYHDKNWGTSPFLSRVQSWYWIHGRLGPYSIVVWDGLTPAGEEYVSGYVARDGEILLAANSSITVRPIGTNAIYPPTPGDKPTGFTLRIDMGNSGIMDIDIATTLSVDAAVFGEARFVGQMTGGIKGSSNYTGPASLEQYAF
ncbi:putative Hydroxyneurosporene synthase protein [Seiridium unicorne]|uniref:Hydroxyneurosporene synthase protein n=1 Tax=Seiridium unicorne TaxID=138068 RepID=A0ABR2V8V0_9PEZI